MVERLYQDLHNTDNTIIIKELINKIISVDVEVSRDDKANLEMVIGDYSMIVYREKSPSKDNKYNIVELSIHNIVDWANGIRIVSYDFELLDIEKFKRAIYIISKKNKNFYGDVLKIKEAFEANGFKSIVLTDVNDVINLKLDKDNNIRILRVKNNIILERVAFKLYKYSEKLRLSREELKTDVFKQKIENFISNFESPLSVLNELKRCDNSPEFIHYYLSRYFDKECLKVLDKISSYGCETYFMCGNYTIGVRCLKKGSVYNHEDFEVCKDVGIFSKYKNDKSKECNITYSIGYGFTVGDKFYPMGVKRLMDLSNKINLSDMDLSQIVSTIGERVCEKGGRSLGIECDGSKVYFKCENDKIYLDLARKILDINGHKIEEQDLVHLIDKIVNFV